MPRIDSIYKAIDDLQLGMDELKIGNNIMSDSRFREGMNLVTEVRDFLLEVKLHVGNFTLSDIKRKEVS